MTSVVGSGHFGAQHAQSLEAWFTHTPGINVIMPSSPSDANGLLIPCLESPDPGMLIQHAGLLYATKVEVGTGYYTLPLGRANVLREGRDVTLVTYGTQVKVALDAAAAPEEEGINVEVIGLRSPVPVDLDTVLESVGKTRRCVITYEATLFCGPGTELAARVQEELFNELLGPVLRLGGRLHAGPLR